jgi:prepilin-type N-terminal cleavage/methylation domain-containing protein
MKRNRGFTLIEIMIVSSIIALLALFALPGFIRARQTAQEAKFINALRVAGNAFDTYAMENNSYPADVNRGVWPPGMQSYFGPEFDWTAPTPIGGTWDWDSNNFGFAAGISVVSPSADIARMQTVDRKIDDGDLTTGHFQDIGSDRYTDILQN